MSRRAYTACSVYRGSVFDDHTDLQAGQGPTANGFLQEYLASRLCIRSLFVLYRPMQEVM